MRFIQTQTSCPTVTAVYFYQLGMPADIPVLLCLNTTAIHSVQVVSSPVRGSWTGRGVMRTGMVTIDLWVTLCCETTATIENTIGAHYLSMYGITSVPFDKFDQV